MGPRQAIVAMFALPMCGAVNIEMLTATTPVTEARDARDPTISGDGSRVAFSSDSDFLESGLAVDANGVMNIWTIDLGQAGDPTKLSDGSKPSDRDAYRPSISHDGSKVCFESNIAVGDPAAKVNNIRLATFESGVWSLSDVTSSEVSSRDAKYCKISGDGSTIVFESDIDGLVPGVTVGKSKDQIFITRDGGDSFELVTPSEIVPESDSGHAAISSSGDFVAFRTKMAWPQGSEAPYREEAWLWQSANGTLSGELAKFTNLDGKECDTDVMLNMYVGEWPNATADEGITAGSSSSCQYASLNGIIHGSGTIGVGSNSLSMSGDARFIVYTTDFDVADTFGAHDGHNPVAGSNLFLFDRVLGFTWQVTKAGPFGSGYNNGTVPKNVEDFCCPEASSSKQRGACSLKNEIRGLCCWQKPCGFPALNPMLSGDGSSIVFVSDIDYLGTGDVVNKDLEIWHYHIPTSALFRITATTNSDIDDVYPEVTADGKKVVWVTDANYADEAKDNVAHNQLAAATLTFGCSRHQQATNYLLAPDVEECCTFPSLQVDPTATYAEVSLAFAGNLSTMSQRLPFPSPAATKAFCEYFAVDVQRDLACALGVPLSVISVMSAPGASTTGCDWASTDSIAMTVHILSLAGAETAFQIDGPETLAQDLLSQYSDHDSRLWKGYLIKTLTSVTGATPVSTPIVSSITTAVTATTTVTEMTTMPALGGPGDVDEASASPRRGLAASSALIAAGLLLVSRARFASHALA